MDRIARLERKNRRIIPRDTKAFLIQQMKIEAAQERIKQIASVERLTSTPSCCSNVKQCIHEVNRHCHCHGVQVISADEELSRKLEAERRAEELRL